MKPLIVLLASFALAILAIKIIAGDFNFSFSGRIGMAVMLAFTGVAHFIYTKGMTMMLPKYIPFQKPMVLITGVIEIAAAIGLLIPDLQTTAAWLTILFFIMITPANVYSAQNHVDYQKGTTDGKGPKYLWFRIPLQIFFIAWTYFAAIY